MTMHGFGKSRFEQLAAGLRSQLLAAALTLLPCEDDAEDAVQETLLKLWGVRERIAGAVHFRNLAFCMVRQVSLNMLRSIAVRKADTLSEQTEPPSFDTPQRRLEQQEQAQRARKAWLNLPQHHRLILHMKEVEGLSTEEIARLLGTTAGNVRTRLSRARKEMLARMGGW